MEFMEPDKSLKYELGSDPVTRCGSIPVSNTRGGRFKPFYCNYKYFCHLGKTQKSKRRTALCTPREGSCFSSGREGGSLIGPCA